MFHVDNNCTCVLVLCAADAGRVRWVGEMGTSILASGLMTSLMAMVQPFTLLPLPNPSDPPLDSPIAT